MCYISLLIRWSRFWLVIYLRTLEDVIDPDKLQISVDMSDNYQGSFGEFYSGAQFHEPSGGEHPGADFPHPQHWSSFRRTSVSGAVNRNNG